MKLKMLSLLVVLGIASAGGVLAREECPTKPEPVVAASDATAPPPSVPAIFPDFSGGNTGTELVFLGDSLTRGHGASSREHAFPSVVSALQGNRRYQVLAIGGQKSGSLASLFMKRVKGLSPTAVVIIWIGRNNFRDEQRVIADIGRVVDSLGGRKYLVLGILRGTFRSDQLGGSGAVAIGRLNSALEQRYGPSFLQIDSTLTCDDWQDNLHLHDSGYAKVARLVSDYLLAHSL